MKIGTDIRKFSRSEQTMNCIRKKVWPSLDDAAQAIYDNTKDKESVELKVSPYIYCGARYALTIGITAAIIVAASTYFKGCNKHKPEKENYNKFIHYVSNVPIQK